MFRSNWVTVELERRRIGGSLMARDSISTDLTQRRTATDQVVLGPMTLFPLT